jgi:hypothetical protein
MQGFHDILPSVNGEFLGPFFPKMPHYFSFVKQIKQSAKTFHFIGNKDGVGILFVSIQHHFRYAKSTPSELQTILRRPVFTDIILSRFLFFVSTVDFPYLYLSFPIFLWLEQIFIFICVFDPY